MTMWMMIKKVLASFFYRFSSSDTSPDHPSSSRGSDIQSTSTMGTSGQRRLTIYSLLLLHFLPLISVSAAWVDLTTDRAREDFLDAHNECRSREFSTPVQQKWVNKDNPPTDNTLNLPIFMLRMVYDMMLESYAREYSKYLCENGDRWGHSRKQPPHRVAPGENLYATTFDASESRIPFDVKEVVEKWWKERDYYDWSSNHPTEKAARLNMPIGHYTQVVRAEASAVGCVLVSGCKEGRKGKWKTYGVCHYDFGNLGHTPYYNAKYPHTLPANIRSVKDSLTVCGYCPRGFMRCGSSLGKDGEDKRDAYLCLGFWDINSPNPPKDLYRRSKEENDQGQRGRWRAVIRNCEGSRNGGCGSNGKCFNYGKSTAELLALQKEPRILAQQCMCNKSKRWTVNDGIWWKRDRCLSYTERGGRVSDFTPSFAQTKETSFADVEQGLSGRKGPSPFQNSFLRRSGTNKNERVIGDEDNIAGMGSRSSQRVVGGQLMQQVAEWAAGLTETDRLTLAGKYRPVAMDVDKFTDVLGYEDREISALEQQSASSSAEQQKTESKTAEKKDGEEERLMDPDQIERRVDNYLARFERNLALAAFFENYQTKSAAASHDNSKEEEPKTVKIEALIDIAEKQKRAESADNGTTHTAKKRTNTDAKVEDKGKENTAIGSVDNRKTASIALAPPKGSRLMPIRFLESAGMTSSTVHEDSNDGAAWSRHEQRSAKLKARQRVSRTQQTLEPESWIENRAGYSSQDDTDGQEPQQEEEEEEEKNEEGETTKDGDLDVLPELVDESKMKFEEKTQSERMRRKNVNDDGLLESDVNILDVIPNPEAVNKEEIPKDAPAQVQERTVVVRDA